MRTLDTGKQLDEETIGFIGMVTPDIVTDLNRGVGALFLLQEERVIDASLFKECTALFAKVRTQIKAKGIVNLVPGR